MTSVIMVKPKRITLVIWVENEDIHQLVCGFSGIDTQKINKSGILNHDLSTNFHAFTENLLS